MSVLFSSLAGARWCFRKRKQPSQGPKARQYNSLSRRPSRQTKKSTRAEGPTQAPSIPHIPLIDRHMIFFAEPAYLLLETPLGMVRLLPVDIPHQFAQIRRSNRKQPIPTLPRKSRNPLLLHPHGRTRLQLRHHLRRRPRPRQPHRKVHMIFYATHAKTLALQPTRCPGEIRVQSRRKLFANQGPPFLRTENNMHQIEAKRLRHPASLTPLHQPAHPTEVARHTHKLFPVQQSAKGAKHNSLGQRPRSTAHQKPRAESPTHRGISTSQTRSARPHPCHNHQSSILGFSP